MNKTTKGQADMKNGMPSNWKVTVADKSDTGSVMDTERPNTGGPYDANRQIGPVSKTGFGQNRDGA